MLVQTSSKTGTRLIAVALVIRPLFFNVNVCSGRRGVQHNPRPRVKMCINHVQECLPIDPLPPKQKPRLHSRLCLHRLIVRRESGGKGTSTHAAARARTNEPLNSLPSLPLPPSLPSKKNPEQLHGVQKPSPPQQSALGSAERAHSQSLGECVVICVPVEICGTSKSTILIRHRHTHNLFHDSFRHLLLRNHLITSTICS